MFIPLLQKYPNLPSYPAFNTMEDTKDYLTNFTDRNNYTLHIKVTQIVADVILRLCDSAVIPFNVQNIADTLITGKNKLKKINSTYVALGEKALSIQIFTLHGISKNLFWNFKEHGIIYT